MYWLVYKQAFPYVSRPLPPFTPGLKAPLSAPVPGTAALEALPLAKLQIRSTFLTLQLLMIIACLF